MADSAKTEEYNGTTWVDANDLTSAKRDGGSAGTQTAGLAICGNPSGQKQVCYEYDGTNWSTGGSTATQRHQMGAWGIQTDAIVAGTSAYAATSEAYNGTSWSSVDNMPTGKSTDEIQSANESISVNIQKINTLISQINPENNSGDIEKSILNESNLLSNDQHGVHPSNSIDIALSQRMEKIRNLALCWDVPVEQIALGFCLKNSYVCSALPVFGSIGTLMDICNGVDEQEIFEDLMCEAETI